MADPSHYLEIERKIREAEVLMAEEKRIRPGQAYNPGLGHYGKKRHPCLTGKPAEHW